MDWPDHLFRREAGRMVATLTRIFGVHNLSLAEDVVQDAFCRALEVWKFRGVPENPSAWLMATAKHRALDVLRRERTVRTFAPELGRLLDSEWTLVPAVEGLFEPHAIQDDELRMMFSCCDPRLAATAQVALVLHILCGFSVGEVAAAFLVSEPAMAKRIHRAKKVLAASRSLFDLQKPDRFHRRLKGVQRALYLLFNEGYHGASPDAAVRIDLCGDAIRLAMLLLDYQDARTPGTYALAALLCLHGARLPSRLDAGRLQPLSGQDRSRWDQRLLLQGREFLDRSAEGDEVTTYHLEAGIALVHARAMRSEETDWRTIVSLYDALLALAPSPVVALNRAVAIAQADGPERGLDEISRTVDSARLAEFPFYPAALGELELRAGRRAAAADHFRAARLLARNGMERDFFEKRLRDCE